MLCFAWVLNTNQLISVFLQVALPSPCLQSNYCMDGSLGTPLHRVQTALNWSGATGLPKDGDVKTSVNQTTGVKAYNLRAQPRSDITLGVSFFVPGPEFSERVRQYLGRGVHRCMIISSLATLPPNLCFVHDTSLRLPLPGEPDLRSVVCGDHWVLHTTADMSVEQFESHYTQVVAASTPCDLAGGAEPSSGGSSFVEMFGVDADLMPGDKRSSACVMALDALVVSTHDDNVRLFASLFAFHMRAVNISFEGILGNGSMASLSAAAMEVYTVRDPYLSGIAFDVQDELARVLEFRPSRVAYKPYWVSWDTHH